MSDNIVFAVGDGVTLHYMTDAHAYTVIAVSPSGKTITIQRDKATLSADFKPDVSVGGFAGHTNNNRDQSYTYDHDPDGNIYKARLTKRGWCVSGQRVTPGRHEFYDYNF